MMITLTVILVICGFVIVFAMAGYPILLKLLDKALKPQKHRVDTGYEPAVSYMIVAHNEEAVIKGKLENALTLDYPRDKFEIIVASDNSTDATNDIVEDFISRHGDWNIRLYKVNERKGKTNAQNEAQKVTKGEILVMTDANAMIKQDAIRELVSYFTDDDIAYVCGKLEYSNSDDNLTGESESTYWNLDLYMRDVESRIQTITAGNGALYACRNSEYIDFDPIYCHDSSMPFSYAMQGKRALFNPKAVAVEKAGESNQDEFKRKVRMNRIILTTLRQGFRTMNVFRHRWFSLFYFGHRMCRYSLWIAHIVMLICSVWLMLLGNGWGAILTIAQAFAVIAAILANKVNAQNALFRMIGYYGMTVFAQVMGVINIITGKAKPFWESVESTR